MTEEEFTQLTMPYCRRIFYSVRRIVGSDDASDVMQDILKKLWENRENFALSESQRGYISLTARSVIANKLKDRKRYADEQDVASTMAGPEEQLMQADNLHLARTLLSRLSPTCREVMQMAADGFSNSEIAEATGLSNEAVRANLSRGRRKIKQQYEELQKYEKR